MPFSKKNVPDCDKCTAHSNCLCSYFDAKARKAWKDLRVSHNFMDGEFLFNDGDTPAGLYIVCSGRVKMCKTSPSGQQLISRIEESGDLAGHITLLAGGNFQTSGEIMGDSVISLIDKNLFMRFLQNYPHAAIALMQALARDVEQGDSKAHDIAYKSAKSRMADILLKTSDRTMAKPLVKDVKRRELAEMAGLTVETAVRILAEFEKKNILRRKGKEIVITNLRTLEKIATAEG